MIFGSWDISVDTPFGEEVCRLTLSEDGSIAINHSRGTHVVPGENVVIGNNGKSISSRFELEAPIITTVQIDIDTESGSGFLRIGEFLNTKISCTVSEDE